MAVGFGRLTSPAPCDGFIESSICRGEGVEEMKLDEDDDGGGGGHAAADTRAARCDAHTVEPAVDAVESMVFDEIPCSTRSRPVRNLLEQRNAARLASSQAHRAAARLNARAAAVAVPDEGRRSSWRSRWANARARWAESSAARRSAAREHRVAERAARRIYMRTCRTRPRANAFAAAAALLSRRPATRTTTNSTTATIDATGSCA